MTKTRMITVSCPYCRKKGLQPALEDMNILYCDPDNGGCDRNFIVTVEAQPVIRVFKLIEVEPEETKDQEEDWQWKQKKEWPAK